MVFLFVLIFFWYSQVTETAFIVGVKFIEDMFGSLNKLFVGESRGEHTQAMLGENIWQKGIPHKIEFVLTWLTFAFIGIGVITLLIRYKEMSFPELNFRKTDFLHKKFEVEYFVVTLICAGLLVVVVSLPYITVGYSLYRAHLLGITILSIFFVIGGIVLSRHLKVRAYLIILLVLIPYFLCVTGAMYDMFGVPRSVLLNSGGEEYDLFYVHDQESRGAMWLRDYATERQKIHAADFFGGQKLISQGMISPSAINTGSFINYETIDGYIYLRRHNVVNGELMDFHNEIYNMTDYQDILTQKNEIYDSGCSKIYY